MSRNRRLRPSLAVVAALAALAACATLAQVVQPLSFSAAPGQQAQLRLFGPSPQQPLGGVGVRLWARVQNPNPLGVTLTHLAGNVFLSNTQAGTVDLPLGVALQANGESTFPVDVSISFASIPSLAGTLGRALGGAAVPYRLDGRFSVGAGALGSFDFGPSTLLEGNATVLR